MLTTPRSTDLIIPERVQFFNSKFVIVILVAALRMCIIITLMSYRWLLEDYAFVSSVSISSPVAKSLAIITSRAELLIPLSFLHFNKSLVSRNTR